MAREKPLAENPGVRDEAGIAVLILCLCHSIGFAIVVALFPQFRTAMPQAEILTRLLILTAFFASLVILGTGFCVHQDRNTLVRFSLGIILLLLSLCGLVDCRCTEASASASIPPHAALLNASLPSVPCLILISAHIRNRRALWSFLQKSRRSGKRSVRRFIV
jgi:hypothetical protein